VLEPCRSVASKDALWFAFLGYSIPDVRIADSTPSINSGQASLPQVIIAGANPAHINVRSTF